MQPTVDDLFERYRRGETRALAAVFDRTALELWQVARCLSHDRDEADDLLQATWLSAMQSAARWRSDQRLMPWLLGILANHVRMARRRQRREVPAAAVVQRAAEDPVAAAQQQELRELLRARVEALPEIYRAVLVLQIEHGMTAAEVAHALGRARATVRSQLHRGLELLRRTLPAALAGYCGRAETAPDLGSVRGAVLAAAGGTVGVVSTAVGAGALVMQKLIAAGVLVLAAGVYLAWPGKAAALPADAAAPAPVTPAAGAANTAPTAALEQQAAPQRIEVPPLAMPTGPAAAAEGLQFVGRCIAAENGAPLANVAIAFAPTTRLEAQAAVAALRGADSKPEVAHTHTGADGCFALGAERGPGWLQTLSFTAPGRFGIEGNYYGRDDRVDLGDIAMATGVAAAARVVDAAGTPQPGLEVTLSVDAGTVHVAAAPWLRPQAWLDLRSRADGSLPLPAAMMPGRWSVVGRDREVLGATRWDLVAGGAPFDIVVEANPQAIAGLVTDPLGVPIEGVAVQPMLRESYMGGVPCSDAVGRFAVRRWSTDRSEPHRLEVTRPGYRALRTEPIAWGTADLHFVLQPARELELLAVDADDGAPVETFGVRVLWDSRGAADWRVTNGGLQAAGRHEGGRALLLLDDGPHRLCVQPGDGRHTPGDVIAMEVGEAMPRQLVVRLQPTVARVVELVTAAGEPVAGSNVELWRPGVGGFMTWDADALEWQWGLPEGRTTAPPLRLQHAMTRSDGRVQFAVAPREALELRASGPSHMPLSRAVTFAQEKGPLRILVEVGAGVVGQIEPPEFVARIATLGRGELPTVQLVQDGVPVRRHPDKSVPIAADGTFEVGHVPPGEWQVVVVAWVGAGTMTQLLLPLGAPVTLADGERRQLRLDARPSMPCTLRGRVFVNGVPWSKRGVQLRLESDLPRLHEGGGPTGFGIATDADGVFTLTRLPARYRVLVEGIEAAETCRVAAGSITDATFTITCGTIALQFVDAAGSAVPGAVALLLGPSDTMRQVSADAAGRVQLLSVPGAIAAGVLPAALRDPGAMQEFRKQHAGERALRDAAMAIAVVEVTAGSELPLRIVVPAAAGY